ncbi:MAG: translation initiation factor IF-2 [Clostridia bacterium]|nr:translation initiation factor IF-2 [Clostridia bacterium]
MTDQKYRVHEVGKDFNVSSKEIMTLLESFGRPVKNHMTALSEDDLNLIFDYYTQKKKVESLDAYFASFRDKSAEESVQTPKKDAPEETKKDKGDKKSAPEETKKPKAPSKETPEQKEQAPQQQKPAGRFEKRYIDTKGADVNLGKFDERLENLAPERAKSFNPGKQKIKKGGQMGRGKKPQRFDRAAEEEKQRRIKAMEAKKQPLKVTIPEEISVGELAQRLKISNAEIVKKLMMLGIMASVSQVIDYDTAALVSEDPGAIVEKEVVVSIEERLFDDSEDPPESLVPRSPVVVVMGHVDHGKTSLLDAIRHSNVTDTEAGGITQHIGAYRVEINGQKITFLDTPGHEAFTAMRQRGAQVTDIAILVVAADDGIMPQTIEAINHAKAAGVNIIVAINKIDKEGADPERIKQELTEYDLLPEEWGGDTICVPVSAKKREGIDTLLEMVLLVAEMKELKANPNRNAKGTVIEAKLDRGRGPVATVIIQNGTLKLGDVVIAGTAVGRVRAMVDENGRKVQSAGPSVPVEIVGFSDVPTGGDEFYGVNDEKMARELVEQRKEAQKQETFKSVPRVTLDDLFNQVKQGEVKDLNLIIKADVQGSVEAVKQSLEKISNDEVRVRCIHGAVGAINESDVMLASVSNAIIVGFNVRPDAGARASAEAQGVDIRLYRVIYTAIEEIEAAMKGMLAPEYKEVVLGTAEVRQVFKITGAGTVAGCYVQSGKIVRNAQSRIIRDGIVVHEGELGSLKRFKDDAKEVSEGFECGITIERFNDIKEGDVIEAYVMEEIER